MGGLGLCLDIIVIYRIDRLPSEDRHQDLNKDSPRVRKLAQNRLAADLPTLRSTVRDSLWLY